MKKQLLVAAFWLRNIEDKSGQINLHQANLFVRLNICPELSKEEHSYMGL